MIAPWLTENWRRLTAQLGARRLPHALLLAGPAGLGKRGFAQALAARALCRTASGDDLACGECRACAQIAAGTHPDLLTVSLELRDDGKLRTEITIDQIRALGARLSLTPQLDGLQLALIDPADALNDHAANALLKTLEEPSADTVIVLVSDQPSRLPATIRSRCVRVDARFPPRQQALAWLIGQGVATERAETALAFAAGNPGEALDYARGERAQRVDEVAVGLTALLGARIAPAELAASWADPHARTRLGVLAQCLRLLARQREAGLPLPPGPLAQAARLLPVGEFPKLWAAWERTSRACADMPGPLRPDLVLLEVLASVRDIGARAGAVKG
jgi:DNA polymerase-3 subunit delta'